MKQLPLIGFFTCIIFMGTVISLNSCKDKEPPKPHYQLYLYQDSISVWDGDRWVTSMPYDSSKIANDLLLDNL